MTRLRWREPGAENDFNRWIQGVLNKEMVLAHSSYARAAGLQSEINKVTVTRVAGSEVEYKRQLNLYRKDMLMTVNDIKREQTKLRKSIRRYSKKMRQGKVERMKRERQSDELDRKNAENMSRIAAIFMLGQTPVHVYKVHREDKEVTPDSGIDVEESAPKTEELKHEEGDENEKRTSVVESTDEKRTEEKSDKLPQIVCSNVDDERPSVATHLPSIIEGDEKEEEEEHPTADDSEHSGYQVTEQESSNSDVEDRIDLQLRTLKPKRQVVSFADIIKLQHTTNTKKLFNLVNLLAKQHGVGDKEKEKESRNNSVNRGSTEESNASLRAASVLYPIKYGYTNQDSELSLPPIEGAVSDFEDTDSPEMSNDDKSDRSAKKSLSRLTKSDLHSRGDTSFVKSDVMESPNGKIERIDTRSAKRMRKRNKSLPVLIDEVQKIKLEQMHKAAQREQENFRRYSLIGTDGATQKPRTLPPLPKQSSDTAFPPKQRGRSSSISWTEAFGLLRGVHNLHNPEEY